MAHNARHTIILVQSTLHQGSRTYMDYETLTSAVDGVCQMFEQKLKELNPNLPNITYEVSDLFRYVDSLVDMSALVYDPKTMAYQPHDKEWIKNRVFNHLKKQVS
mmetsp:Transcript_6847/g.17508  ORF Transcript_6847/g.17508 Transcript_6847/m.17508 type:complete len:105 (-) Transcript_6847:699-1013(-)|eukprot:jgi/Tetstr1/446739/TSEL_034227.t1